MEQGMYFLHEHPAGARRNDPEVFKVNGNMCAFGMYQEDENGRALVKKKTLAS